MASKNRKLAPCSFLFFFSLIVVLQFADDCFHFKLCNGSVLFGHFLVN